MGKQEEKKNNKSKFSWNKFIAGSIIFVLVVLDRGVASKGYQTFIGSMTDSQRNIVGITAAILIFVIVVYLLSTVFLAKGKK